MTAVETSEGVLGKKELAQVDAQWRAANYLAACQIYLLANPLLTEPLRPEHVKPRLLGHWGTSPGLNFVYAHLNRAIVTHGFDALFVTGPGHGGPALLANTWLEGSYTEAWPEVTRDAAGMEALFRQFSFPGGVPSHVAPQVPGSIHEGGELGYSLAHAFGAAFDNPDLVVACVVGDGEAETGPLATSWHANKFLDPTRDGVVLPILHLNGYKIANPTVLARIGHDELDALLRGYGYAPRYVEGADPVTMHQAMAATMDEIVAEYRRIRERGTRPVWPMIVLRSPKGWTGPSLVDGHRVEGTWRAHQVPLASPRENPEHLEDLERWLRSYRPHELFDHDGRPGNLVSALIPRGARRMGASPHANGGSVLRPLALPRAGEYSVAVARPGVSATEPTRALGRYLRDVFRLNAGRGNFRLFGPDETASNRLDAVFEATNKEWQAAVEPVDEHLAVNGRVLEVLSEHLCQGWLEGYLLTGRHGLFSCYEAFTHIVDSMVNQHVKWLKVHRGIPWRRPVASFNYLLTSHVWRQDHNGFSHQDPGFVDHVANKSAEVVRVYFPPDTNTLLHVMDHCLRSRDYVNVVVAGKNDTPDWLDPEQAALHCARGVSIWDWASAHPEREPDVVLACAGDAPTLEVLAAAALLRELVPELAVRVVNVVDLMRLQPEAEHPHGMSDREFDALFTPDRPVIFAYHGYPWLIHRLSYRRGNHHNLHVRGYTEHGTTTTPFDMLVLNSMDRFQLVIDVIDRVPGLVATAGQARQRMTEAQARHHAWIREHGEDLPEIRNWSWDGATAAPR
ncbi:phosphoketolase family protein [Amycolatopsis sp. CA-230715]|uniref:phosphoketolase family protein n=1 Tax=Amycolatopsis sp. CA-230715 TaxID=2745196 RepID=UPI001C0383DC|nr:phosphoketolase family protein [Amycolatopsis sp. CA-230715]QWF77991.1 Xylulose-5-phosphate phosphoketolase [Amycolatopsis sp. CA-230715]